MAIVRNFEPKELERSSRHTEVEATLCLVEVDGEKFIQIDTYGSDARVIPGKVSQSLRLSQTAFDQLKATAENHF